jgi:hypothetical protein
VPRAVSASITRRKLDCLYMFIVLIASTNRYVRDHPKAQPGLSVGLLQELEDRVGADGARGKVATVTAAEAFDRRRQRLDPLREQLQLAADACSADIQRTNAALEELA